MPLSSAWSGRLALLVGAALALLIVWQGVRLAWVLVDGPQVTPAAVPEVPRLSPATAGRTGEFHWELFGAAGESSALARPAPVSRSSLRLRGIVASDQGGYAIIADGSGADDVFRVGDELPDGASVEAIEPRRVIISRNGRTEALEMGDSPDATTARSSRQGGEGPAETEPPGRTRDFEAPAGASVASLPNLSGEQSLQLDATGLSGAVSVLPVPGGGFRVRPGRDATLFSKLGLQVNDVVVAVNGQPLESEDSVRSLFADVMQRREISITVNRQGREVTLRPDLEEIVGSL